MRTSFLGLLLFAFGFAACSSSSDDSSSAESGFAGGSTTGTGAAMAGGATGAGRITSGSGGLTGAGGIISVSGGAAGAGGFVTGSGAAMATGGAFGVGGVTGAGGAIASGGMTGDGGAPGTGGTAGTGGAPALVGPCDIYESSGTPCVAAHSTVRALYGTYGGKLYQVRRSDNTTKDIAALSAGGVADSGAQDAFCSGTTCVITFVYDQTGHGNDLAYQGPGSVVPGSDQSKPAVATTESLTVNGKKVYSLYIKPGNSYWKDGSQSGVPTGSQPEALYMVTSGTHYNAGCCFDYGNSETDRKADAAGAMDAINFSNQCWFAQDAPCVGSGPWVQADLEWGLYAGGSNKATNPNNVPMTGKYVTAMLKNNGTAEFALEGGNAQSGSLTTLYKGALPGGYSPMKKQGAIVLGSGGDCCKPGGGANLSEGTFYEGAIVSGYPSDATDGAIQANVIAAAYGK